MMVRHYPTTLDWWQRHMGFAPVFTRPAQKLAFLQHADGAQVMIYERDGDWEVGPMEPPFGRGAVIQVFVADVAAVHARFPLQATRSMSVCARNGATGATVWAASVNFWCRTPMAI